MNPTPPQQHEILRVLVGSHAFGTAEDGSDRDERTVFMAPTWDFFRVDHTGRPKVKETLWVEDRASHEDTTGWEVGRFVKRALHCDPNTLQVLWAPVIEADQWGGRLRSINNAFLSTRAVYDAFSGYASNQVKKMLAEPTVGWTPRNWKFAEAYLRALMQGYFLLADGELVMDFSRYARGSTTRHDLLVRAKHGEAGPGEIVQRARELQNDLFAALNHSVLPDRPDINVINIWLRGVRQWGWGLDAPKVGEAVL